MNSTPNSVKGSALTTFIGGIVILLAVLFFLVKLATGGYYSDVADMAPTAVETRIKPAGSLTMGAGQFCTNPGISVLVDGPDADRYTAAAKAALAKRPID